MHVYILLLVIIYSLVVRTSHSSSFPPLPSLPALLFVSQANVNSRGGSHKRTPLHYASLNNHVATAATLLAAGANEYARDADGLTALNLSMGGDMCKLLHKVSLL